MMAESSDYVSFAESGQIPPPQSPTADGDLGTVELRNRNISEMTSGEECILVEREMQPLKVEHRGLGDDSQYGKYNFSRHFFFTSVYSCVCTWMMSFPFSSVLPENAKKGIQSTKHLK